LKLGSWSGGVSAELRQPPVTILSTELHHSLNTTERVQRLHRRAVNYVHATVA
jgi:hypothetical protein